MLWSPVRHKRVPRDHRAHLGEKSPGLGTSGMEWSDSRYTLKKCPTGFAVEMDLGYKNK